MKIAFVCLGSQKSLASELMRGAGSNQKRMPATASECRGREYEFQTFGHGLGKVSISCQSK